MKHLILLLFIAAPLVAQNVKVYSHRNTNAVDIRWIGNADSKVTGWHVERVVDGGQAVRLTTKPLTRIMNVSDMEARVGRYLASYFLMLNGVKEFRSLTEADLTAHFNSGNNLSLYFAFLAAQPSLSELTGEMFTDSTAPLTGTAVYRIIALRGTSESLAVTSGAVQLGNASPIEKPQELTAEGMDNSVRLTWRNTNTTADNTEIVGYRVYRATAIAGPFQQLTLLTTIAVQSEEEKTNNQTSYVDALADNGKTYFYYITNIHATGNESSPSNIAEIVVGENAPLHPVSDLQAHSFGKGVQLTWKAPPSAVPHGVVLLRTDASGLEREIHSVSMMSNTDTSAIDALVSIGETYQYRVASVNSSDTVYSSSVSFFIPDDVAPQPPTNLRAVTDTGKITLLWHASADKDVVGYHVERSAQNERINFLQLTSDLITDTVYVDLLAPDNQATQGYVVIAVDGAGNRSTPSATLLARSRDITPPAQPEITKVTRNGKQVTLVWSEPTDADVLHAAVERSYNQADWTVRARVRTTSYTDTLSNAGNYRFRIIVVDSLGNRSAPSTERSIEVDSTLPASQRVTVVAEQFALRVSWQQVKGAAGYRVQRLDMETNETIDCANVDADVLSWTDRISDRQKSWTFIVTPRNSVWEFGSPVQQTYRPSK